MTTQDIHSATLGSGEVVFVGIVIPQEVDLFIQGTFPELVVNEDISSKLNIQVDISFSKIKIIVGFTNYQDNILTLRNLIQGIVDRMISAFCVDKSYAYRFYIEGVHSPLDKKYIRFTVDMPGLTSENDVPKISFEDLSSLAVVVDHKFAGLAVCDYREAMTKPDLTAAYCYRAYEALANGIAMNLNQKDRNWHGKWDAIREALKLKRETTNRIDEQGVAQDNRHGKLVRQTESERVDRLKITREIIRRYLLFIKHNNALPAEVDWF